MDDLANRQPYKGDKRGLVISIDFGTTFSGVSYAFLEPGIVPTTRSVTGFPGQEDLSSSTKVPSVSYYDKQGNVRARGGEINDPDRMNLVESEDWIRVEWFKLLMRPKGSEFAELDAPSTTLPPGKSVTAVLGDFIKYMSECTQSFIGRTHAEGHFLWEQNHAVVHYILSHPNGWGGLEQCIMRSAVITSGVITDTRDAQSRVHFVSEGEASLYWCIESGLATRRLKVTDDIVIADCGGGTIDVSAFRVVGEDPLRLEETKPPECRLAGSAFVTKAFEKHVQTFLKGSVFGDPETIDRLCSSFEYKSKRIFRRDSQNVSVQFGGPRETDTAFGIRSGRLTLSRDVVARFFERSCGAVVDSIKLLIQGNSHTTVFIVGGFAASPYLLSEVEQRLANYNVTIKRAESHTAKAVADGAIAFYVNQLLSARVAKHTLGIYGNPIYDPSDLEHVRRNHKVFAEEWSSRRLVSGRFFTLVLKGTRLRETDVSRLSFNDAIGPTRKVFDAKFTLYSYTGDNLDIRWMDQDAKEAFRPFCTFASRVPEGCLAKTTSAKGQVFWRANYAFVLAFGKTEFTCHIEWKDEEGIVQRERMKTTWFEG